MSSEVESKNRDKRWDLRRMTALVTGGTKGLGHAIVDELAALGAIVHTCARNQEQLNESIREWKEKGFKVTGSVCDVSSDAEREKLMKEVSSLFDGKLDILKIMLNHEDQAPAVIKRLKERLKQIWIAMIN
ncbi:hypothetical protein OIU79_023514 [Salix purpurea]|uniref:Tropinone reductase I n=1 Tax=Salix purpurea TaxID=77065 RepID=A0A9Q0W9C0_SALPP|nr:hypothetical protein OIU79_023514 [Salix purpurea]